jgi:hypothetical protein
VRREARELLPGNSARRRALHLVVGTPKYHKAELMAEALDGLKTCWTINSEARAGDVAYFYMTAPDSAVNMRGVVLTDAEKEETPGSEWEGFYFSDIGELEIFVEAVPRREIMGAIPAWRHVIQPVKSARVRAELADQVERFFDRPVVPRPEAVPGLGYAEMHYQTRAMCLETASKVAARRDELVKALAGRYGATEEMLRRHVAANMRRTPGMSFDVSLDSLCAVAGLVWQSGGLLW